MRFCVFLARCGRRIHFPTPKWPMQGFMFTPELPQKSGFTNNVEKCKAIQQKDKTTVFSLHTTELAKVDKILTWANPSTWLPPLQSSINN